MKMKQFLAALLTLTLVLGALPASLAMGDPSFACNHPSTKWVDVQTVPDCRYYGVQAQVCTTCGAWVGPTRDARGPHSWGEWVVTAEATCQHTGKQQHTCSLCNTVAEQTIPRSGHKGGVWTTVREATCAAKGLQESSCVVCGAKMTREIALLPHNVENWTVTAAPTCVKTGSRTGTCTACGGAVTEKLEAAGHSWDEGKTIRAPKCDGNGYKDATCTVCGVSQRVIIPATGHTWGEWTVIIEPDGANRGKREHRCTRCNKCVGEYFYAEGTLKEGDQGEDVLGLNVMLDDLGYESEKDSDQYTKHTKAGVNHFQKDKGHKGTGVADETTQTEIISDWITVSGIDFTVNTGWMQDSGLYILKDEERQIWQRTLPARNLRTWGPWRSNGRGLHYRLVGSLAQYEIEECDLLFYPLQQGRKVALCPLCGYRYILMPGGKKWIIKDDQCYVSNGDGTHTVQLIAEQTPKSNTPQKSYKEDCDLVLLGSTDCNESGRFNLVCRDCGYEKQVDADGLTALGYTVAHQGRTAEPRCSGDITLCTRCGYVYSKTTTGTACVYETTWYRTDAELAAFAQKHGDLGEHVCCAWEKGKCLNCRMKPPADERSWGIEWHDYALVDGQSVCVKCGRACPQHEAEATKGAAACSYCGQPFAAQAEACAEGKHSFSVLTNVYGGSQSPAAAALAAEAGVYDYCYAELQQCTRCGKLRLSVIRDEHFWEYDNGDAHCLACGEEEHRRLNNDGKGAPCTANGMMPLTCLNCGAEVMGYPDPETLTHDFEEGVTKTCYADIRHCRRCGEDVPVKLTGNSCDHLLGILSTPEEIIAAGYDPTEICYVKLHGDCKVCGAPLIEMYSEEEFGHHYETVNGREVCANCGRVKE